MINKKLVNQAAELGKKAFLNGAKRVPALDAGWCEMLRINPKADSKQILAELDAWLKAWDTENFRKEVMFIVNKGNPRFINVMDLSKVSYEVKELLAVKLASFTKGRILAMPNSYIELYSELDAEKLCKELNEICND